MHVLSQFKLIKIYHKWYDANNEPETLNERFNHFKALEKQSRNIKIKCICCEEYKAKHEIDHLKSKVHMDYIKKEESEDFIDF